MLMIRLEGVPSNDWIEDSVGRQLYVTSKSARAFHSGRLAAAGATFGVWTILATLHAAGPLIQRELATRVHLESPTLTRYLVQMEADGLVRRPRSETDRRATTVELTEAGRARYRGLLKISVEGHAQLLHGFSEQETASLLDMLARIRRNIGTT